MSTTTNLQALRKMRGGLDQILRMVWKTVIEDYKSLEPFLVLSTDTTEEDEASFRSLYGPEVTPEDLIANFLAGSGVPCEVEWAAITGGGKLQDVPSSQMLEKPSFRPRMMAWAMTGSPHLPAAADNLKVSKTSIL